MRISYAQVACCCALIGLSAVPVYGQAQTPAAITGVDVLVLPAAGDVNTVAPIANGTRSLPISATAAACNQPMPAAPPPGPLVNPRQVALNDPFTANRACLVVMPAGLAAGTGYRVAVKFTAAGSCTDVTTGAVVNPCESVRSVVTSNTVTIQAVTTRMSAPANVVVAP